MILCIHCKICGAAALFIRAKRLHRAPVTIPCGTALLQGWELPCFPCLWKAPGFNLADPPQHPRHGLASRVPELAPHGLSRGSSQDLARHPAELLQGSFGCAPCFPSPEGSLATADCPASRKDSWQVMQLTCCISWCNLHFLTIYLCFASTVHIQATCLYKNPPQIPS